MRQDSWVTRYLETRAFVIYVCHACSEHYYSRIAFAAHLLNDHDEDEPRLYRFLGADSERPIVEWLNDPAPPPQAP